MNLKDLLKVGPENKSDTRFKLLVLFGLGSWVYKHGIVKFVIACIILVAIAALVEAGGNISSTANPSELSSIQVIGTCICFLVIYTLCKRKK